jgi:hypothetical protein
MAAIYVPKAFDTQIDAESDNVCITAIAADGKSKCWHMPMREFRLSMQRGNASLAAHDHPEARIVPIKRVKLRS